MYIEGIQLRCSPGTSNKTHTDSKFGAAAISHTVTIATAIFYYKIVAGASESQVRARSPGTDRKFGVAPISQTVTLAIVILYYIVAGASGTQARTRSPRREPTGYATRFRSNAGRGAAATRSPTRRATVPNSVARGRAARVTRDNKDVNSATTYSQLRQRRPAVEPLTPVETNREDSTLSSISR